MMCPFFKGKMDKMDLIVLNNKLPVPVSKISLAPKAIWQ